MATGDFYKTMTGFPPLGTIEDIDRHAMRVTGQELHVCLVNSDVTDAQGGIFPVRSVNPQKAITRALRKNFFQKVCEYFKFKTKTF